ncbi:hypothetical protein L0P88_14620 [Muricauda sp. SCSIO 64092]|uniref:hypothetical protein n=1 Tax=Allomuricauda sp. SCSIO 64092 TaxID=2908842 RepID=UPI001FF65052|nr:hypothetical protein [Muricauda sp. SCSIO 64092]UOY05176.1 hypothetical protein L0P88_14620 [Muricauda sp. SCSIO 64092]
MKKATLTLFTFSIAIFLYPQQWTGPDGGNTITTSYNVGIGTGSPAYALDVYGASEGLRLGDSNNFLLFRNILGGTNEIRSYGLELEIETRNSQDILFNSNNGNSRLMTIKGDGSGVGIGTSSPTSKLHISGNGAVIKLQNTSKEDTDDSFYGWLGGYDKSGDEVWWLGEGSNNRKYLGFFTNRNGYDLRIFAKGQGLIVKNNGDVGIGTETPDAKLAVNGNIHTKEVKVDMVGWPDYVFDKDYELPSLKEVENYIKEKGHLQDIPSAQEVVEDGIMLGEMNAKLLQKIEELMLYTIAQQKEIQNLVKEMNSVKARNQELQNQLNQIQSR